MDYSDPPPPLSGASLYLVVRTFALIVSAHPYCAGNSLRDVMRRHALSAFAVEEMWRYIALAGTLMSMHGFNSLKCSMTPNFLLIDHILCRLSMFCEKIKENLCCGSLIFFNFSALASSNSAFIVAVRCSEKSILEVEFNLKDDTGSNYLLDRPT